MKPEFQFNSCYSAIQLAKETDLKRNLQLYLKRSLWKAKLIDIPCYIDENILQKSSELIKEFGNLALNQLVYRKKSLILRKFENYTVGCIQALAAIQVDCYSSGQLRFNWAILNNEAAAHGNLEIIKIVSPLMENPNSSWLLDIDMDDSDMDNSDDDNNAINIMFTPIYTAILKGHLEIVKFLVPLSNNLDPQALQIIARKDPNVEKYLRSMNYGI